jgi:hypothetical protein
VTARALRSIAAEAERFLAFYAGDTTARAVEIRRAPD